ncbi:MAG: hypothetical protein WC805_03860 [Patescibacteria group bacterium]|jgi:hypothetical protein
MKEQLEKFVQIASQLPGKDLGSPADRKNSYTDTIEGIVLVGTVVKNSAIGRLLCISTSNGPYNPTKNIMDTLESIMGRKPEMTDFVVDIQPTAAIPEWLNGKDQSVIECEDNVTRYDLSDPGPYGRWEVIEKLADTIGDPAIWNHSIFYYWKVTPLSLN